MSDTDDCLACGCPLQDHVPMRYALRCWTRHRWLKLQDAAGRRVGRFLDRLWWQM